MCVWMCVLFIRCQHKFEIFGSVPKSSQRDASTRQYFKNSFIIQWVLRLIHRKYYSALWQMKSSIETLSSKREEQTKKNSNNKTCKKQRSYPYIHIKCIKHIHAEEEQAVHRSWHANFILFLFSSFVSHCSLKTH